MLMGVALSEEMTRSFVEMVPTMTEKGTNTPFNRKKKENQDPVRNPSFFHNIGLLPLIVSSGGLQTRCGENESGTCLHGRLYIVNRVWKEVTRSFAQRRSNQHEPLTKKKY